MILRMTAKDANIDHSTGIPGYIYPVRRFFTGNISG